MVDGGLKALEDIGLRKSRDVKKLDPVEVSIDTLDYERVINTKELETSFDDYIILDVREDKEFNGGVYYGEAKGGHLPGSVQVKFVDLFDSDGYLKSNEEITSIFEDANIKKTDKVVAYCTAAIIQLDSKKYMVNSIVWIILTTVSYSIKKGYYSYSYELGTTLIRLILSILVFIIIAKKYHKDSRRV